MNNYPPGTGQYDLELLGIEEPRKTLADHWNAIAEEQDKLDDLIEKSRTSNVIKSIAKVMFLWNTQKVGESWIKKKNPLGSKFFL